MRALVVALVLLASPRSATGEDLQPSNLSIREPAIVCTLAQPERCRQLRPGRYLDDDAWAKLDAETRRLQTAETRLAAENASMRKSLAGWRPGWKTLALALASGIAAGTYVAVKIAD